jgi:hypothetical protein
MTHSAIIEDGPYRVQAWVRLAQNNKWIRVRDGAEVKPLTTPERAEPCTGLKLKRRTENENADIVQ